MKYVSKRVVYHVEPSIVNYLEKLGEALVANPVPETLSTGEKLAFPGTFAIQLAYFLPDSDTPGPNENQDFCWFLDTNCFDWVSHHNVTLDACKP